MKSNTKVERQLKRKTSSNLVQTLIAAKKSSAWKNVAGILASPRKNHPSINLDEINDFSKEGEIVVVPGKVLSMGEVDKKIKIVAFKFSEKAKEKLLKSKKDISSILEEIKKNPEAKGVRVFK
jgi:large subunit ribosomal protein L18e|tara:strand:+ start:144 stop:512 length:369 start_codon:yes stop_codon:yes gene_type:complete